jgi:hypothetical protein
MLIDFGVMYLDAGLITVGLVSAAAAVAVAAQMLVNKSRQAKKVKVPVRSGSQRRKKNIKSS